MFLTFYIRLPTPHQNGRRQHMAVGKRDPLNLSFSQGKGLGWTRGFQSWGTMGRHCQLYLSQLYLRPTHFSNCPLSILRLKEFFFLEFLNNICVFRAPSTHSAISVLSTAEKGPIDFNLKTPFRLNVCQFNGHLSGLSFSTFVHIRRHMENTKHCFGIHTFFS